MIVAVALVVWWWKSCGGNAAVVAVLGLNKRRIQFRAMLVVKYGCLRGGGGWQRRGKESSSDSQESSVWPEEWLQWHPHAFFTIPAEVSTNTSRGIQH